MDDVGVLDVWAAGRSHPAERPLLMLRAACPDLTAGELAELPLGQRNRLLLRDRRATFGDRLEGDVSCPQCGQRLELEVALAELFGGESVTRTVAGSEVQAGDVALRFRLPKAADLEAVSRAPDPEAATAELLRRCVVSASRGSKPVPVAELPSEVIDALDAALASLDPDADLRLATACASCAHAFDVVVDPGDLFWAELAERAERLFSEVHRLAGAYGWTESEILRLDPARRAAYLELVG